MGRNVVDGEQETGKPSVEVTERAKRSRVAGIVREFAETLLIALIIVFLTNTFLLQSTIVLGQSMDPTLLDHERILIDKLSYRIHPPQRGDVIVFNPPNDSKVPYIKRVIGLPGEHVEIKNGSVYIDGKQLIESYTQKLGGDLMIASAFDMPERVVEPNEVFVLGDNRGASNDSRFFGDVTYSSIIGRAFISYWPVSRLGLIP